jgi:hypothetical protein
MSRVVERVESITGEWGEEWVKLSLGGEAVP